MSSKRFDKLPKKTFDLPSEEIKKLIQEIKKTAQPNLMSQLI